MTIDTSAYLERALDLAALVGKKSHFLFGPRQTGKTSLIRHTLPNARVYDLLDSPTYLTLSRTPERLGQEVKRDGEIVVLDEVQRLPELLNEVHRLIEARGIRFLLTGSSARKLRRGGVNLLGGRARVKHLHPLTARELGRHFDLPRALERGTLPSVYFSDDPRADLESYAGAYLQQEIMAEGATRNVPAFSRFLRVAALCNGTLVNFTNVANDAQVPRTTIHEYFEILRDTLVIHEVPAWQKSLKRKPLATSKYYFFDVGVVASLQGRNFCPGTPEYGEALETYVLHELFSYRDYVSGMPVSFWRSKSGFEVDFVVGDELGVEVKAKRNVGDRDLRGLRALGEERMLRRLVCVCLEPNPRKVGDMEILPIADFLAALTAGDLTI